MAKENYARCLANTLVYEGGWSNHPQDPGGPTMRGVIQRVYDDYRQSRGLAKQSVRNITEGELQDIYRTRYWDLVFGDRWPKGPDQIIFDIGVNSGVGRPGPLANDVLGIGSTNLTVQAARVGKMSHPQRIDFVKALCARRARFYRGIRTFGTFGKGWLRRNAGMEAIGVKMCLEAAGVTQIGSALEVEKEKAEKAMAQAKKGAAATAGGGTAAGGGAATTDPGGWEWWQWLGAGALTILVIVVLAVAAYAWIRHRERVKAYAAALADEAEATLAGIVAQARNLRDEVL
jgi:lysozyme family protein